LFKKAKAAVNRISLKKIIRISFISVVCLTTIAVYFQTFVYTSQVKKSTTENVEQKVRISIFEHIDDYLKLPEYVNNLNIVLANSGQLNLDDEKKLGQVFLKEVTHSDTVDYAYYANEAGGIVSSGRYNNKYMISETKGMKSGDFIVNNVDANGNVLEMSKKITDFDPRTRSWYKEAKLSKKSFWSEVYGGVSVPTLGITASAPLLDVKGNVIGVFGTDILLDRLSEYMHTLKISPNGSAYLMESSGLLIASSTLGETFIQDGDNLVRVNAESSSDPILNDSWNIINNKVKQDASLLADTGKYSLDGKNYYLDISRYSYNNNFNWYLLIVIPENDFNKDINTLFLNLTGLMLLILIMAVILGTSVAKLIIHPIQTLNENVIDISNGKWGTQIKSERNDDLGELTRSFNDMSQKIKDSYDTLVNKNIELKYLNTHLEDIVKIRTEELRILAITDELTGLYNHRYLIDHLQQKAEEAKRYHISLSVAMFDIDFFKNVNDTYGHQEGNNVLIDIAACLKENARNLDVVGRYGGEEFLLILPHTSLDEAYLLSERIRVMVSNLRTGSEKIEVTISGGIAEYQSNSIDALISLADQNLYIAKATGRNQIVK